MELLILVGVGIIVIGIIGAVVYSSIKTKAEVPPEIAELQIQMGDCEHGALAWIKANLATPKQQVVGQVSARTDDLNRLRKRVVDIASKKGLFIGRSQRLSDQTTSSMGLPSLRKRQEITPQEGQALFSELTESTDQLIEQLKAAPHTAWTWNTLGLVLFYQQQLTGSSHWELPSVKADAIALLLVRLSQNAESIDQWQTLADMPAMKIADVMAMSNQLGLTTDKTNARQWMQKL